MTIRLYFRLIIVFILLICVGCATELKMKDTELITLDFDKMVMNVGMVHIADTPTIDTLKGIHLFGIKEIEKEKISNELKFYEEVWGPPLRELQQVVESGFTIKPICDLNKQLLISVAKGQKIKIYINELKIIFCYLSKQSLPNINKWKIQESPEDTDKKLVFIVERKEENQSKQMRANLTANFMVRISDDDTESLMDTYFVEWKGWYSLDAENGWTPEKNIIYNFSRIPHDSGGTQTNNDN